MFKYKTIRFYKPEITRVEIERETNSYVWIKGRRHGKRTAYETYLDSWDEAKTFLLEHAKDKIASANYRFECEQEYMAKVEKLEKPDPF